METDNREWLKGCSQEDNYHNAQYKNQFEYTKKVGELLNDWDLISQAHNVLDLGCGAGAPTYYFATLYNDTHFSGVDLNPKHIDTAKRYQLKNTSFARGNFFDYEPPKSKYEGIISLQTLSWISNHEKLLVRMMDSNPNWILITSLFYEGPVEVNMLIKDHTRSVAETNVRTCIYNIYSFEKIQEILNTKGYTIAKFEKFILPIDLKPPTHKGMGTYTKYLEDEQFQLSGPIIMPWYTVLIKKQL